MAVPLLNTVVLLASSASLTYSHHALLALRYKTNITGLVITIQLAMFFTALQYYEFTFAPFTIHESVYGSTFFALTGLHGLHILFGTLFLVASLIRLGTYHNTDVHHLGYKSSIIYWHFVDLV